MLTVTSGTSLLRTEFRGGIGWRDRDALFLADYKWNFLGVTGFPS